MSKILITATNAMMYHFLIPHIKNLLEYGYEIDLACTNLDGYDEILHSKIDVLGVDVKYIRLDRSPFKVSNYQGIKDLKKIINSGNYDLIWTNEPVMSIATRLAARKARKEGTKVMYIVHGFHFFKGSSKLSWLIYYPIERFMAHFADCLVTINKEDYKRGQTFDFKNVYYIHGVGLDTKKFSDCVINKREKRKEIGIPEDAIVMMSVGELGSRKNHEVIIKALGKIMDDRAHYLLCGEGVLETYLKQLAKESGVENNVHFLGYRKDIAELCKCADIYVFPSKREGLGIGALEGMAAGLPLISSYVNGIRDYTQDGITGLTVSPYDVDGFADSIKKMAQSPKFRFECGANNKRAVKKFDINNTKNELYNIIKKELEKQ